MFLAATPDRTGRGPGRTQTRRRAAAATTSGMRLRLLPVVGHDGASSCRSFARAAGGGGAAQCEPVDGVQADARDAARDPGASHRSRDRAQSDGVSCAARGRAMSDRLWRKRGPDGQPTGSWYGAYFDAEGTRRLVCTRQLDRQAARKVLRELERKATAPRGAAADPALTVGDALRYLVEESNAKDWAASTLRMFAQKAGHALRLLGTTRLVDLRQGELVRYCDQRLAEGAARETVRKELSTIKAALAEAVKLEWLIKAPSMPPFTVKYRPRDRWLTETEARDLLLALAPARRLWVTLALYTGCRLSEIERLACED